MTVTNEAIIERLILGQELTEDMVQRFMARILAAEISHEQIAAVLSLWRAKGVSAAEFFYASSAVIDMATPILKPDYLFADIVGTGGDGHNTINVSTLASLTAASLGLPMAKHGSVSSSSLCGSADVLKELGLNISMEPKTARKMLDEYKWCFLFAPVYHPVYKAVKDVRQRLKIKTIFNILGPLANPLAPPIMMVGVYEENLVPPFIQALKSLKRKRALVIHGSGLDEIALHGKTVGALLDDGVVKPISFSPEDLGLKPCSINDLKGGKPEENARIVKQILGGHAKPEYLSFVAASSGVLLWLAEKVPTIKEGVRLSLGALEEKKPLQLLERVTGIDYGT